MSDNGRWKIYGLMSVGGVVMALWLLDKVLQSEETKKDLFSFYIYLAGVAVLIVVSAVNLYTAFAFKFGRVDEVAGSMESAALIQGGKTVLEGARIQLKRAYDLENTSLTDDQRNILFICNWRPWVCLAKNFHCM